MRRLLGRRARSPLSFSSCRRRTRCIQLTRHARGGLALSPDAWGPAPRACLPCDLFAAIMSLAAQPKPEPRDQFELEAPNKYPDFSPWHLQHKTNASHHPEQYPGQGSFRPPVATYYAKHGEQQLLATLSALRFPTAAGAIEAFLQVEDLHKQSRSKFHDAAAVSWPAGGKAPSASS